MSNWLEHSVQIEIPLPIDRVWELWSDIENMSEWMGWIDSVEILPEDPDLSRWKLSERRLNFEFTWLSRIYRVVPHQLIQWESVDGLPNRGAVRFYDRKGSSIVRLSIAYDIPGIVGKILDRLFLGQFVEASIRADMERFRDYALAASRN